MAVLGPDGAGKSTLIKGLRPLCPPPIHHVKVSIHAKSSARRPGAWRWLVRTLRCVSVLVRARFAIARGALVVWDRHPMEDRVMASEGRRILGKGRGWLAGLAPRPDLVVLLEAPVEVLIQRRKEEEPEQLGRLAELYLRLAAAHRSIVVDATRSAGAVQREVARAIEHHRSGNEALGAQPEPGRAEPGESHAHAHGGTRK